MGLFYLTGYMHYDILLVEVRMRNQFAKKCCWCKVVVPAGMGKVWNYNDRWYVGCQDCIDDRYKNDDDNGD
jgi:hypothetical protein